ncbi:MAG: pyridoxal-dependent decarboxylase [Pseudomonadota bacterium]
MKRPRVLWARAPWRQRTRRLMRPVVRAALQRSATLPPSYWGLRVVDGRLHAGAVDLAGLCPQHGSPLHVVLGSRLRDKVQCCQAALAGASTELFFSYKTNPVPGVLRVLHALGVGAEVISPYELWLAQQLGVPGQQIVYGGPGKDAPSIRRALELDIRMINVNHREELEVIAAQAAALGRRARIALRVAPAGGWSWQFGLSIAGGEALEGFRAALASPHLQVVGLHAHRGELMRSVGELRSFVQPVLTFCDELRRELKLDLELLDLGGSLAVPSVASSPALERRLERAFLLPTPAPDPAATLTLPAYAAEVSRQVAAHFNARGRPVPTVILEPGRALSADCQLLLCQVRTLKARAEPPTYAILDAGIHVAEPVAHAHHTLFAATRMSAPATTTWRLVGPTCTPHDVLYSAWQGPELQVGDVLAIMDAGAYLVPFSTTFSFPRPGVVLVDDGRVVLLRRAETFEDLVARDVMNSLEGEG